MFKPLAAFSGVAVQDLAAAKKFYTTVLGLSLSDETMGLQFKLPGGGHLFVYEKKDHTPATFTVLNFVVADIDEAVDDLTRAGVIFERFPGAPQDSKNIARGRNVGMGPDIAWFTDPAGNIISVLQDK